MDNGKQIDSQKVSMYDILIGRVISDISKQINDGDIEAISELLSYIPRRNLICFLPEEDWSIYEDAIDEE